MSYVLLLGLNSSRMATASDSPHCGQKPGFVESFVKKNSLLAKLDAHVAFSCFVIFLQEEIIAFRRYIIGIWFTIASAELTLHPLSMAFFAHDNLSLLKTDFLTLHHFLFVMSIYVFWFNFAII